MTSKNGIGFGLGLGGLLLFAAATWSSVALGTLPHRLENLHLVSPAFLLGVQVGISGLIAGWLSYELAPRVANGHGSFRVALMTFFATGCAVALSIVFSLLIRPFSMHILALYFLLLPFPCLVIVPLWAAAYLQLIRLQERFGQNAGVPRRNEMIGLLASLRQQERTTKTMSSEAGELDPPERLAVSRRQR